MFLLNPALVDSISSATHVQKTSTTSQEASKQPLVFDDDTSACIFDLHNLTLLLLK